MLHFQYSSLINAPVEVVWQFHERKDVLQLLTPPWQPVEVVRREGGLGVSAITEFNIYLGLIPVRWLAQHIECEPYSYFTDEQIDGPVQSWVHRHQFTPENGQTRLTDSIDFELPGGELVETLLNWWVQERLRDMFRYRHEVTQRECKS